MKYFSSSVQTIFFQNCNLQITALMLLLYNFFHRVFNFPEGETASTHETNVKKFILRFKLNLKIFNMVVFNTN